MRKSAPSTASLGFATFKLDMLGNMGAASTSMEVISAIMIFTKLRSANASLWETEKMCAQVHMGSARQDLKTCKLIWQLSN